MRWGRRRHEADEPAPDEHHPTAATGDVPEGGHHDPEVPDAPTQTSVDDATVEPHEAPEATGAASSALRHADRRRAPRPRPLVRHGLHWVVPALLLLLVVTLWPLGRAVVESLHRSSLVTPDDRSFVGVEVYASVLSDGTWWAAVGLTLGFVAVAVTAQLALATLFAMTLRRLTHGTRWLKALLLVPFGLVSVVAASGWRDAVTSGFAPAWFGYDGESTAAALVAVVSAEVWRGTGITTLILLAGLARVSPALLEAALADGANAWQRFWRVTRPAAAPAIAVAVVYRSLDALRTLEAPLLAGDDAARTVSVLAWDSTFEAFELGLGATVSMLLLLLAGLLGVALAALLRLRRTL